MQDLPNVIIEEIGTTIIIGLTNKKILKTEELNWHDHEGVNYLSLSEISEQLKEIKEIENFITLIFEMGLSGVIYQYGNYGEFWVEHGSTKGYA